MVLAVCIHAWPRTQKRRVVVGLPEGELRAARADAEFRRHRRDPTPFVRRFFVRRLSISSLRGGTLFFLVEVEKPPHDVNHSRSLGLSRRGLQRSDRSVHHFVDDAAG